ncbi:hypothetical protein H312_02154 [Anncaliia algerae PRA339]|uniref:Uncharacterized protein n=1 Tax=Anncaliia algerae PRA339 TaxID=1288291 RepID=A0A059EZT9_9MICR|nr:hypothetical protein H312_02154 [Anncaliia algerae PRA339]
MSSKEGKQPLNKSKFTNSSHSSSSIKSLYVGHLLYGSCPCDPDTYLKKRIQNIKNRRVYFAISSEYYN